MSRLIDADDLLQEFEKENVAHNSDIWHITGIKAFIENAPTAFDTEKVVEQLEERKEKASGCFGVMCSDCKYTEECHEGEKGYKVAFDRAIDIVKKGGVE